MNNRWLRYELDGVTEHKCVKQPSSSSSSKKSAESTTTTPQLEQQQRLIHKLDAFSERLTLVEKKINYMTTVQKLVLQQAQKLSPTTTTTAATLP